MLPQETISFTYNVGNLGFASSGPIDVAFYLVDYPWQYATEGIYLGSTQLPALDQNTWHRPNASFVLPAGVGGGTYYVAWFASTNVSEYWSDSSGSCAPYCNNHARIDGTPLRVAYPNERSNLRMGSIDASSKFLLQGETIVISGNAINLGNFPASFFWIGAYLTSDDECDPGSDLLLGYTAVDGLAAGGDNGMSEMTVTIPQNAPVGVSRLCLLADDTFAVSESIEIDNAITLPVYVEFNDTIFADSLGG